MDLVNYSLEEITKALDETDKTLSAPMLEGTDSKIEEAYKQAYKNYRKMFSVHLSEIRMK